MVINFDAVDSIVIVLWRSEKFLLTLGVGNGKGTNSYQSQPFNYTERQKKLITSSVIATLTKIHHIKNNHIWTLIIYRTSYEAHLKIERLAFVKKERKCVKFAKCIFFLQKSQKPLTKKPPRKTVYSEHSIATIQSISMAGYVTTVPAFVCGELPAEHFLWFLEITSCDIIAFSPFWLKQTFVVVFRCA